MSNMFNIPDPTPISDLKPSAALLSYLSKHLYAKIKDLLPGEKLTFDISDYALKTELTRFNKQFMDELRSKGYSVDYKTIKRSDYRGDSYSVNVWEIYRPGQTTRNELGWDR